ncbi:MAG: PEP-CTERM sorting domain-containing protein [Gammaproteobacteria bacterium]|nr:PEP-CTERM sorting domain-containing protein [Gammaproteobacteria bacterium]
MKNLFSNLTLVLLLAAPGFSLATPVTVGDLEWRQVTDTLGFSWNDFASVCDPDSGACSGNLGEVSFDGWTWAGIYEIGDLFSTLFGHPGGISNLQFPYSEWAPAFFELFDPAPGQYPVAWGWSRDEATATRGRAARVVDFPYMDQAFTGDNIDKDITNYQIGGWFHRSARVLVPEPGVVLLLGAGLIGLGITRRSR